MPWPIRILVLVACPLGILSSTGTGPGHEPSGRADRAAMVSEARAFLETLRPELRAKATFPFASTMRTDWHFVPKERLGVALKQMNLPERRAAHALLRSALSGKGYLKATTIMSLEQILRALERHRSGMDDLRDQEKYWFAVFGTPSANAAWGWRVEGHHLSLNFSSAADTIIASTPMFLGANPAEVPSGPRAGLRALAAEEDRARAIMASLSANQRKQAVIAATAPRDIITGPGHAIDLGHPEGLAATRMNKAQRAALWQLIREYATNLRPDVAHQELVDIRDAGIDGIYFAWAGSTHRGEGHYYRIHGPTFIIEYDNTQNHANHIHTVWHSLSNDFGLDYLRRHYQESPHHQHRRTEHAR